MATKKQTYEEMMTRIEEITEQLDSDKLTLEEMMALYKEGDELIKKCKTILDGYAQEMKKITEDA